ncbi:MAG: MmgE/PrpD family protein [Deltaproteobacteria bacterium]|nr:MmgE/PrpD family protein [Deltaproteobacteria bacterium]
MEITRELGRFASNVSFDGLQADVVDRVRYLALDFLAVASRGSIEGSSQPVMKLVHQLGAGREEAVVVGTRMRLAHEYAAMSNGISAHALELDDVNNEASLHPGVVIFPVAFALCEKLELDARRFCEAVVAGYEVVVRIGKGAMPVHQYARGFHPTGTCGAFGAAAAAARLMGLDASRTTHALGIAGSQCAGSMEYLTRGAWTKRFNPGWAAHAGIIAAGLAREGFTGPDTIIEGKHGFLHGYSEAPDPQRVLEDLGCSFEILRTSIKPHACCRYMQSPIDGVLKIVREQQLKPDDVDQVEVGVLKAGYGLVAEPKEAKLNPAGIVDAQFSMPFGAAAAILYGRVSLDQYSPESLASQSLKKLMKRVRCVQDPELDREFPRKWPARVAISTHGGQRFETFVEYPKGDPENPLSWDEMIEKFHSLSAAVYRDGRREEIVKRIREMDKERIGSLATLLLSDR